MKYTLAKWSAILYSAWLIAFIPNAEAKPPEPFHAIDLRCLTPSARNDPGGFAFFDRDALAEKVNRDLSCIHNVFMAEDVLAMLKSAREELKAELKAAEVRARKREILLCNSIATDTSKCPAPAPEPDTEKDNAR